MRTRGLSMHPVAVARRATRRRAEGTDEAGFTLIELVITVVILPIVLGGIAAALLAVFGLQTQTQNRIGDSNDARVGSSTFNKDVQSAEQVTTANFAVAPGCGSATGGPSGSQTQLLGLQWGANSAANGGFQTVVSYVTQQLPGQKGLALIRQECSNGQSTTPTSTTTISRDFPPLGSNPAVVLRRGLPCRHASGILGQLPGHRPGLRAVGCHNRLDFHARRDEHQLLHH